MSKHEARKLIKKFEDNKLYPQVFLDEALFSLQNMLKYDRIDISEGTDVDEIKNQKNVRFVIIGIS